MGEGGEVCIRAYEGIAKAFGFKWSKNKPSKKKVYVKMTECFKECGFDPTDDCAKPGPGRKNPYRHDMVFKFYNKNFFLGEGGYEAASKLVRKNTDREKKRAAR